MAMIDPNDHLILADFQPHLIFVIGNVIVES